mmetsp:Transcript_4240/g.8111  ORF Transcript_4240/g.8111 Transcript_4240/m.8111 type:complete len:547 (+) Transcript_4240:2159-3799(+)
MQTRHIFDTKKRDDSNLKQHDGATMIENSPSKSSYTKLPDLLLRFLFVILGMGTLFAYNAFISCTDYYNSLHPLVKNISGQMVTYQLSSMFVMTLCLLPFSTINISNVPDYMYHQDYATHPTITTRGSTRRWTIVFGRILELLDIYSPARRVLYGFIFTFLFLCVYILLPPSYITSKTLNVFSIFVGIADATSQSGLYILAASYSDKPVFTASATLGGALSGLIVSLLRLATRGLNDANTLEGLQRGADLLMRLAFGFSTVLIGAILIIMRDIQRRNDVKEQYMHVGDMSSGEYSIASRSATPQIERGGLSLEMVHDAPLESNVPSLVSSDDDEARNISNITTLYHAYRDTLRLVWKPALSAFLNFFITLSLFPGVLVDIPISKARFSIGNWLPIVLITVFNLSDCLGRYILSFESKRPFQMLMTRQLATSNDQKQGYMSLKYYRYLVWFPTWTRGIFFPLFAICILPSEDQPVFDSDVLRCLIVFLFGLSNGFIQCANFTVAPTLVESEEMKNAVSLLLLLAIYCGLSFGAYFGLLVEKIIRSMT